METKTQSRPQGISIRKTNNLLKVVLGTRLTMRKALFAVFWSRLR